MAEKKPIHALTLNSDPSEQLTVVAHDPSKPIADRTGRIPIATFREQVATDLSPLESSVASLASSVDSTQTAVGNLQGSVSGIQNSVNGLQTAFEEVQGVVDDFSGQISERLTTDAWEAWVDGPKVSHAPTAYSKLEILSPVEQDVTRVTGNTHTIDWLGAPEVEVTVTGDLSLSDENRKEEGVQYHTTLIINPTASPAELSLPSDWVSFRGSVPEVLAAGQRIWITARSSDGDVEYNWAGLESEPLQAALGGTGRVALPVGGVLVGAGSNPVMSRQLGAGLETAVVGGVSVIRKEGALTSVRGHEFTGSGSGVDIWTGDAIPVNSTLHIRAFLTLTGATGDATGSYHLLASFHNDDGSITVENTATEAKFGSVTAAFVNASGSPALRVTGADTVALVANLFFEQVIGQVFEPTADDWDDLGVLLALSFDGDGYGEFEPVAVVGTAPDPEASESGFTGHVLKYPGDGVASTSRWVFSEVSQDEVAGIFSFKMAEDTPGSQAEIFNLYSGTSSAGNGAVGIRVNSNGTLNIRAAGSGGQKNTVAAIPQGQKVDIYFHYLVGTGADAYLKVGFSTDGLKPADGDTVAEVTEGASVSSARSVRFVQAAAWSDAIFFKNFKIIPGTWADLPNAF